MFLTIPEIVEETNRRFKDYPMPGFVFQESPLNTEQLNLLEKDLKICFTEEDRKLFLKYDFGNLAIGWVTFGTLSTLRDYLIENNQNPGFLWWREGERPEGILLIASTDGHNIFIDTRDGTVLSTEIDRPFETVKLTANTFSKFIEVIGTLALRGSGPLSPELHRRIIDYLEADPSGTFWR